MKNLIKKLIHNKQVNFFIRTILHSFKSVIPQNFIDRFPLSGKLTVVLASGKKVNFDSDIYDSIGTLLYKHGCDGFEPATSGPFFKLIKDCRTFIDIGANIGVYSLFAAVENPLCNVYSFEPAPNVFSYLL